MVHYRLKATSENLKEEDYINGFGVDSSLMSRVRDAKIKAGIELPKRLRYDNRIGFAIDLTPFNNQYHPIFQYDLLDTETGEQLQIDSYTRDHWYGYFWTMMAMDKDTRSHRQVIWKNETCHEPDTINRVEKNNNRYKLVPAETPRWSKDGLVCIETK